ncbi:MAG: FAD-dependent oxidoreductase [Caulobacteraceae bacterium]
MSERPTVAIIGAGFSGVLTALRLLLTPDGPKVRLIERAERFGRGAAYATSNPQHLLNVRATNMSAFVEQPAHFVDWLRHAGVPTEGQVFVTRDRYGQYLQSILRRAAADGGAAGRLTLEHDEVVAAAPDQAGWALRLAMGRVLSADAVILAIGNLPPQPPTGLDPAVAASERYAADPWAWDPAAMPPGERVLLLGSGLTAVDMAVSISEARPMARVLAVSRHGLLPRRHAMTGQASVPEVRPQGSPVQILRAVRAAAEADWRATIDGLRPLIQSLWRAWDVDEKRRFLRHLRPYWDVHRHRLAPQMADRLDALRESGRFGCEAGRVRSFAAARDGIEVVWTPRAGDARLQRFDMIVNCVGPREDLTHCNDPLIASLRGAGLIGPDPCGLGLDVDSRSRVIAGDGAVSDTLFAVGPITRGEFYEITSVPDIRIQAADCAGTVINTLAARDHGPPAGTGESRLSAELSAYLQETIAELDVELGSLKFSRRVRNAWELRGQRAALDRVSLWLENRSGG